MEIVELILLALALAMDCFAVSVVSGVIVRKNKPSLIVRIAFLFGLFQALMPLIGWFLTSRFQSVLESVDHWVAFAMLAFIGGKMILDSFKGEEEDKSIDPNNFKTDILLAIATSIDALAVGISFACTGYDSIGSLGIPMLLIGVVSFVMSVAGYLLGSRYGEIVNKIAHPELVGGVILIGIGVKILIEHLELL